MSLSTAQNFVRHFSCILPLLHSLCCRAAKPSVLALRCWIHGNDANRIFEVKISETATVAAPREAMRNKKPVDFGHVEPDALTLYSIPMPDKENRKLALLRSQQILKEEHLLDAPDTLSSLNLSRSVIIVYGLLTLRCWVHGDDASHIFEVNILEAATVAALREAIKDKKPVDFGHVDPDRLTLYSIPIPDDDEQLANGLEQWTLGDASKPLPSLKPLSKLDLSRSVITIVPPPKSSRSACRSRLWHHLIILCSDPFSPIGCVPSIVVPCGRQLKERIFQL